MAGDTAAIIQVIDICIVWDRSVRGPGVLNIPPTSYLAPNCLSLTSSWKVSCHRRSEELYAAPFFSQSECIIYALIQSEMEPHTTIQFVGDNSLFKKMCTGLNVPTSAPGCVAPGMVFGSHRIDIWAACPGRDVSEIIFYSRHNNYGHGGDWS